MYVELKAKGPNIQLKVSFGPSNLTEKNGKFEIFDQGDWLVIGYCSVKKFQNL